MIFGYSWHIIVDILTSCQRIIINTMNNNHNNNNNKENGELKSGTKMLTPHKFI